MISHLFSSLFQQYGRTPLYVASDEGHINVVESLVKAKADLDKADEVSEENEEGMIDDDDS